MRAAALKAGALYRIPALEALPWLEHAFGSRHSDGWPDGSRLVTLRQIHSDIVRVAGATPGCLGQGDALVTDRPGLLLGVRTADCLPVLLADEKRRAVAAVHAGWRGLAGEILHRTLETLNERFASRPEDLWVGIGPGIGRCCYEVGPEVARRFGRWLPELNGTSGKVRLDLVEVSRRQLAGLGVPPEHIWSLELCTCCHPQEFHSWRRDAAACGRMWSVIGIRPG